MTLLIFVLLLSFLGFIHELGHFVMARRAGVRVDEFGFGYPPKMFRFWKDKKGTEYTMNWLPFGGFVRMHGEDESHVTEGESEAFYAKKKRARLGIIVAGAVMNFLFGAVAFGAIYTKTGIPTELGLVRIDAVAEGSPAQTAGLVVGDEVVAVKVPLQETKVETVVGFVEEVKKYAGSEVGLVLADGRELALYVRTENEIPEGQGALGVSIADFEFAQFPLWQMPLRGMWVGFEAAFNFGIFLVGAIGSMLHDLIFSGVVPADVAGPVGIVNMAQRENLLTSGWMALLNFAAILSINLGVINLLPFPALDGGRAVFVLLEGLIKKERLGKVERWANSIGMAFLLLMIVAVTIRDVRVWVTGQ